MKHSKQKPHNQRLAEPVVLQIEKPLYGGAFLSHLEGKAVFIPLTLPGEEARVRITEDKGGYATGEAETIVTSVPERAIPGCRHFGTCGGCHYQHADYQTQLALKRAILLETMERGHVEGLKAIDVLAGEPWGYRNRIRLAFDAAGNPGYRGRRSHAIVPISECPIAAPLLVKTALTVADAAGEFAQSLRQTEVSLFCNSDETELLAGVSVGSRLNFPFDRFCGVLSERIPALRGAELLIEDRTRHESQTKDRWGALSLAYRAGKIDYRVDHGAFFQVNRWLVDELLDRVAAGHTGGLAWDLFAGVGLFSRRLAADFERVVAVESASTATAALKQNLSGTTGEAVQAETLAFLRTQNRARRPDLIVVDPPRSGLGREITAQLVDIASPRLVYVSCDPATLARDLRGLIDSGYAIQSMTLADLFPQTFHLETVVHLKRG
jgi:23S rRNA (uracil1939-C5)-methyltransferase